MPAFTKIGFCLTALLLSTSLAQAETIENLGDLPGAGVDSRPTGISANGLVVVGASESALAYFEAYRWELGSGMLGLGLPFGMVSSFAKGVSADGNVIAVSADNGVTGSEGYIWTSGGGYTNIGDLAGGTVYTDISDISADGTTIVGTSSSGNGYEAFRWTSGGGMDPLGDLAGGIFYSIAYGVSANGNIVVGESQSANGTEGFIWTNGGSMVGLGDLLGGGFLSRAYDVSDDGTIVVGVSESAAGVEAFRWTSVGGMVGLGDLAGGAYFSSASAISGNGNVIVGGSESAAYSYEAFRWISGRGMESIYDLLVADGVDMSNWYLYTATDVDQDGDVIVGEGYYNGDLTSFLVNFSASGGSGITTPQNLSADLFAATVPMEQAQAGLNGNLGQSLLAATQSLKLISPSIIDSNNPQNISPAAGDDPDKKWSFYTYGTLGLGQDNEFENHDFSGTTGIALQINDNLALGGGIIGSAGSSALSWGGESRFNALGAALITAYERPEGLRIYGTAFAAHVDIETDRHYRNGAGIDKSRGETNGIGYGGAARAGWAVPVTEKTTIMPYAEIQISKISLDAYNEKGGSFAAAFADQDKTRTVSIYGAEVKHDFTPTLELTFRGGVGHRLSDDGDGLNITTLGLNGTLDNEEGDRTWLQGSVGGQWAVSETTKFSGELTARSHETQDPAVIMTVGLKMDF